MTLTLSVELSEGAVDDLLAGRRPDEANGLPGGLERTMARLRDAPCELELARGERTGRGWVEQRLAALVVPTASAWQLHLVPTEFLPYVLARMNAVGPRSGRASTSLARFAPGALARALATGDHEVTRSLREHWRVVAMWLTEPERVARRSVEVIDTDAGLWLVAPVEGEVDVTHARPTEVFRRLCALLPEPDELSDGVG